MVAFPFFFSHACRAVPCESSGQSLCWHTLNGSRADKALKNHAVSVKPSQICQGGPVQIPLCLSTWGKAVTVPPPVSRFFTVCARRCSGRGKTVHFRSLHAGPSKPLLLCSSFPGWRNSQPIRALQAGRRMGRSAGWSPLIWRST